MDTNYSQNSRRSLILIADGFEEQSTIGCVHAFRGAGVSASRVALTAGPVKGSRGIVLQPDFSLDQVAPEQRAHLAILPGERRCTAALLTDPRVHRLLERIVRGGGRVALLRSPGKDLEELLRVPLSRPAAQSVSVFISELLEEYENGRK